jgi:uncharacterized protein DUF5985
MPPEQALIAFLRGALFLGCVVAALFFVRFYRQTQDRLFLLFAAAFGVLGFNWVTLAFYRVADETRHYAFAVRLVAFALILWGIVDKNRPPSSD